MAKDFGCSLPAELKFGASTNKMGRLYKGNIQVDQGRHQSFRTENSKKYVLKVESGQKKNKWSERGVNVSGEAKRVMDSGWLDESDIQ